MNLTPTEHEEQVALINWCDFHPDRRLKLIYSHLNGIRCNMGTAMKAKASGAKKGIPDLFLPVPSKDYHGLYIELKRVKGGSLSPEQKEWLAILNENGYLAVQCKGADAAIATINNYLN